MHWAAVKGNCEAIKLLLDHGADVDALDRQQMTPLQRAIVSESLEESPAAKILLLHGTALENRDVLGNTAVILASARGKTGVLRLLTQAGANLKAENFSSWSSLHFAADNGHVKTFVWLINHGLQLHAKNSGGWSAVQYASFRTVFSSFLLNSSSALDGIDAITYKAPRDMNFGPAWLNQHFKMYLRRLGSERLHALANLEPIDSWSPLCILASIGPSLAITNILELGADVDFEGSPQGSALMAACSSGRLESVKILVRYGAAISYLGKNGIQSAVDAARNHKIILAWLLVDRFTEQGKLADPADSDSAAHSAKDVKPWSGIEQKNLIITDMAQRQVHESTRDYWFRLMAIKRDWRVKVVEQHELARTHRSSRLIPEESVRICPGDYGTPTQVAAISHQSLVMIRSSAEQVLNLVLAHDLLKSTISRAYTLGKWSTSDFDLFFNNLAVEASTKPQLPLPIKNFFLSCSKYLSARAMEKMAEINDSGKRACVPGYAESRAAQITDSEILQSYGRRWRINPSDQILEDAMTEALPMKFDEKFSAPNAFAILQSSQAFGRFIGDVRDAVFPTLVSEARKFLIEGLGVNSDVVLTSEQRQTLSILTELRWCFTRSSRDSPPTFETFDRPCLLDRLKLAVQKSTNSSWDWWPLCSPPNLTPSGSEKSVISWVCSCGILRREGVPAAHVDRLRELAKKYPITSQDPDAMALSRLSHTLAPQCNSSVETSPHSTETGSINGSTPAHGSYNSLVTYHSSTPGTVAMGDTSQAFISVLVYKSSRYLLATMNVTREDARCFFRDLVARYKQERGILRCVFSIFVYSHCDFIKVSQTSLIVILSFSPI